MKKHRRVECCRALVCLLFAWFIAGCSSGESLSEKTASSSQGIDANASVVIRQVFGRTATSAVQCSFIELFNRSAAPASLAGWSLQYAKLNAPAGAALHVLGANGSQGMTLLPAVTLAPGQSFLVQQDCASGASLAVAPDVVDAAPIDLASTNSCPPTPPPGTACPAPTCCHPPISDARAVALVRHTTPLGCSVVPNFCGDAASCPGMCMSTQLNGIIDLIGYGVVYGPGVSREGTALPPGHFYTRKGEGTQDTNNNNDDFTSGGTPVLRNSSSLCRHSDPRAAVPLDPRVPTTFAVAASPLYQGASPSQVNLVTNAIDANRMTVVQGRVLNELGTAGLPCVEIDVPDAAQYGKMRTWADGSFAFVANGGGRITVRMKQPGYITAHRTVDTRYREFAHVGDVRLLTFEPGQPVSALARTTTVVVGAVEDDDDGTARQAVLLIPKQTRGRLTDGDPSTFLPDNYAVSVKEVTNRTKYGRDGMPASLPPQSAFTYAVNLSVVGAENQDVTFTNEIPVYVNNFLGFPVGEAVPVGRYDYKTKQWVGEKSGVVLQIIGKNANGAILEFDASNPGPDSLERLGLTAAAAADEARPLGDETTDPGGPARRYQIGTQLWRFATNHFSTWDCNWPWGPPDDAVAANTPPPFPPTPRCNEPRTGSIIDCESQTLREQISVAGTSLQLTYSSARQPGGFPPLRIPLTRDSFPSNVRKIDLTIRVGGRIFRPSILLPTPSQLPYTYDFFWDGLDGANRPLQGSQPASVSVGYVYNGTYRRTCCFGGSGAVAVTAEVDRFEATLWQHHHLFMERWDAGQAALGGWNLDAHHGYDPETRTVQLGSGKQQAGFPSGPFQVIAGTGTRASAGENVTAATATIALPAANESIPSSGVDPFPRTVS